MQSLPRLGDIRGLGKHSTPIRLGYPEGKREVLLALDVHASIRCSSSIPARHVRDVSGTRQGRATAMSGLGGGVAHSMS